MSSTAILSYVIFSLSVIYAFSMPLANETFALLDQQAQYEEMVDKMRNLENKKNALLAEFNKISADNIKKIETLIPSSLNFVKLVADIDAVATRHGISIKNISSTNNASSVGSVAEAGATQGYGSASINFDFEGTYAKFNEFINDLERSLRILDIKSVSLSSSESGIYTYTLGFDTYWSN